jgi:hypothetical protein
VESLKFPKPELPKQITTVDLKGTHIDRSWKYGRACSREKERKEDDLGHCRQEAPSEITRSTVVLDCGDRKCSDFKNPRAGCNRNHGISKGIRGS